VYYTSISIIIERKYIVNRYTSVYISNGPYSLALKRYGRRRIPITYVDGRVRRGYLILARILANYKE